MLVKESGFPPGSLLPGGSGLEMPEPAKVREKKLELENHFWWDLRHLGIRPRSVDVLGDRVLISDGTLEVRVPVGVLSAGFSVLENDEGKRLLMKDWSLARQIGYVAWHGRRGCNQ